MGGPPGTARGRRRSARRGRFRREPSGKPARVEAPRAEGRHEKDWDGRKAQHQ
jgi:hypothetical protein